MADGICWECGAVGSVEEHHVVPRSKGGTRTVPLCPTCHGLVHGIRRLDTSRLTREALAAKKARGEHTGGPPPYGYRLAKDGVHLVEEPLEQRVIEYILFLRREGVPYREITAKLEAEYPGAARGARWHTTTVSRIVAARGARDDDTERGD